MTIRIAPTSPAKVSLLDSEANSKYVYQAGQRLLGYEDYAQMATEKLGPSHREVTWGMAIWQVWDDPKYVLYVSPARTDVDLLDEQRPGPAAEAFLWDMGWLDRALTRVEHDQWHQFGVRLAEPCVEDVPSRSPEELKGFVRDYCDQNLLCDHQVRGAGGDLSMVFLCIGLGAHALKEPEEDEDPSPAWIASLHLPLDPGDKPESEPDPPLYPLRPDYPPKPEEPYWLEADPEHEKDLLASDSGIEVQTVSDLFDEGTPLVVKEYRKDIERKNTELRNHYEAAIDDWEAAKVLVLNEWDAAITVYETVKKEWRFRERNIDIRVQEWERRAEIRDVATMGFNSTRLCKIGTIYEYISEAGPRSINGFPCFFSHKVLNRSDFMRAHAAIGRELKRRDEMEI